MAAGGTGKGYPAVRLAGTLLALAFALVAAATAEAEPLRLGYRSWVAPGPFFVARDKGWFAEEGIEVELVNIEDVDVRAAALASGELDAMVAMVDATVRHFTPSTGLQFVFAVSDSRGGDGLVASRDIKSIAGLRGKRVAVDPDGTARFYLNLLLRDAGLSENDVTLVPLSPGAAGHAFETGQVDAAVTWEPWLGRTRMRENGHVLADTSERPGLLIEAVVAPAAVLRERAGDFAALYRAWRRAVAFTRENPEEADRIMAAGIGRWLRHHDIVADMRRGIAWYDGEANAALFGAPGQPGPLAATVGQALVIWDQVGKLQARADPMEMIGYAVVAP